MINLTANAKQADFVQDSSKTVLAAAGEQSGKTIAACYKVLLSAFMLDGYNETFLKEKKNYKILIVEPTQKQLKLVAWPMVKNTIEELSLYAGFSLLIDKNISDKTIIMQSSHPDVKVQIIMSSYEQTEAKIEGLDTVFIAWLDEVFQCPKNFYDQVHSRTAITNGRVICTGSVKPDQLGWIKDTIIKPALMKDQRYGFHTWCSEDNPYWSKEKIQQLKDSLPAKVFNRRYNASLTQMEGQVFDMIEEDKTFVNWDIDLNDYEHIYAGMDFGFGDNPGTIIVVGHRQTGEEDDKLDVLFELYETGVRIVPQNEGDDTWISRLHSLFNHKDKGKGFLEFTESLGIKVKGYNESVIRTGQYDNAVTTVFCDPAEPEYIESVRRAGIRAEKGMNARRPGFDWLMTLFTPVDKDVRLRINKQYCPNLINEIQLMRYDTRRTEEIVKENDHAVDALRYCCFTILKTGRYSTRLRNEYLRIEAL